MIGVAVRKLSTEQVTDLVREYQAGATTAELATTYRVHRVTVSDPPETLWREAAASEYDATRDRQGGGALCTGPILGSRRP